MTVPVAFSGLGQENLSLFLEIKRRRRQVISIYKASRSETVFPSYEAHIENQQISDTLAVGVSLRSVKFL